MSSGSEGLLATLHRRSEVLDLVRDKPRTKDEILSELTISRSTVDRALRELETHDCVTRDDGAFVATVIGRILIDTYETHSATVDGVGRATDVLVHLPRSAPLSPEMLADAEVLQAEPPAPHTALEAVEHIITNANRVKGLSVAATSSRTTEIIRQRAVEGVPIEFVFSPEMATHLRTDLAKEFREPATGGNLDLYEKPDLPFGLLLGEMGAETRVAVVVYGPRSKLVGVVVNDTAEAVIWATKLYRSHRQEATPIEL